MFHLWDICWIFVPSLAHRLPVSSPCVWHPTPMLGPNGPLHPGRPLCGGDVGVPRGRPRSEYTLSKSPGRSATTRRAVRGSCTPWSSPARLAAPHTETLFGRSGSHPAWGCRQRQVSRYRCSERRVTKLAKELGVEWNISAPIGGNIVELAASYHRVPLFGLEVGQKVPFVAPVGAVYIGGPLTRRLISGSNAAERTAR